MLVPNFKRLVQFLIFAIRMHNKVKYILQIIIYLLIFLLHSNSIKPKTSKSIDRNQGMAFFILNYQFFSKMYHYAKGTL